jgi:hypothetical protein
MKNRPKSPRDKKRSPDAKKPPKKMMPSERGGAKPAKTAAAAAGGRVKTKSVAAATPESVAPKDAAPKGLAPKALAPKDLAPKEPAPKREAVLPKQPAVRLAQAAANPELAKRKDVAAKPQAAAPKLKETGPRHEDVVYKREEVAAKPKPAAAKPPAPAQFAILKLPHVPRPPSLPVPRPACAAPAAEWSLDAAGQSALAVNRKLIEIAQAAVTSSFEHARNLACARSPVEMMQIQMRYWQERMSVLATQAEELRALSAALVATASEPIRAQMRRSPAAREV